MRSLVILSFVVGLVAAAACSSESSPPAASSTRLPDGGTAPGGPGTPGDPANPAEGGVPEIVTVTNETLDLDGTQRSYVLVVPKNRDASKTLPLVLALHGDTQDGNVMRALYNIDVVTKEAAVVAYPSGTDQGWTLQEPLATNVDMKYIAALVDRLATTQNIDKSHVFGVGYSSGGYFLGQMQCRRNGFFRGLVVHAAGAPDEPLDPEATKWPNDYTRCKDQLMAPQGGVPIMSVMGTADDPGGGEFIGTYWAYVNGCQDSRTAITPSPCEAYQGCPADRPVTYCLIPGLGHFVWDQGAVAGWDFLKKL